MFKALTAVALLSGCADAALRGQNYFEPNDVDVKKAPAPGDDKPRPASLKKFVVRSGSSGSKVASYWRSAGGSSSNCPTAVAVANAESNFDCSATYTNTGGSIDRGLWQINDYWHPEVSDSCAFDCQCNANGAYSISHGGSDWTPWATYNSGKYVVFFLLLLLLHLVFLWSSHLFCLFFLSFFIQN